VTALPGLLALLALPAAAPRWPTAAIAPRARPVAQIPAGMRRLPYRVSTRHAAGGIVAAHDDNLSRHYGTDASLDPATTQELATWLAANAGTYKRVSGQPPEDRISRSAWFIRKHDEVAAATWKLPAVKSAANCSACHTQSDLGDFNERNIRIPR
jgi:hypothetical protein